MGSDAVVETAREFIGNWPGHSDRLDQKTWSMASLATFVYLS